MTAPVGRRIQLVIDIEGAEPIADVVVGYQPAADWLLDQLGRNADAPYPPVGDEAELGELVAAICDKLGTSGVDVRWTYVD